MRYILIVGIIAVFAAATADSFRRGYAYNEAHGVTPNYGIANVKVDVPAPFLADSWNRAQAEKDVAPYRPWSHPINFYKLMVHNEEVEPKPVLYEAK